MKKLLTMVLALALVFALAAPALAITSDTVDPNQPTAVDFINLDVALFQSSVVSSFGFDLSKIASNKYYVANELAYWGVGVDLYAPDAGETRKMQPGDYMGCTLRISTDAMTLQNNFTKYFNTNGGTFGPSALNLDLDDNQIEGTLGEAWFDNEDHTLFIFGTGVVNKQGVIKAEIFLDKELPVTIYNGTTKLYDVSATSYGYDVVAPSGNKVEFVVNQSGTRAGKVDHINVVWNGATYTIGYNVSYGSTLHPTVASKALLSGTNVYDIAVTTPGADGYLQDSAKTFRFYEDVMNYFGFNPFLDGYLRDVHFLAKSSGLYLKDQANVNLYTGSIVQPDPSVTPPKTGDAASLMGFAMIAVALAAMGYVVSRKVRA
jgi:hypothetical protein